MAKLKLKSGVETNFCDISISLYTNFKICSFYRGLCKQNFDWSPPKCDFKFMQLAIINSVVVENLFEKNPKSDRDWIKRNIERQTEIELK